MNTPALCSLIESELLLTELWEAGKYLDACDSGKQRIDARRYQRYATKARLIIDTCAENERMSRVCSASPALRELTGMDT
jgi:hypothetical protein